MYTRDAGLEDVNSIVLVHKSAFPGFFLTLLGKSFLFELYASYLRYEDGILRVLCDQEGEVVGFVAGCTKPERFYSNLKFKRGLVFALKMLPGFFVNPSLVFKRFLYAVFYKGESRQIENSALLSSIGVKPEFSRRSFGKTLLADFEEQVRSRMVYKVYLTTDKFDNASVVSFYKASKYVVESEFKQSGGRVMLRFIKNLGDEKNGF
ncbi:MAG: GNAT family N-acetyltransferase [Nitrincola lacisaponensis]|uniref:GNAT family N-acetyltransferase n=1 Tax=Nitrincola lacisaponensis TaxID=267850 RepID=UPI00391A12D4